MKAQEQIEKLKTLQESFDNLANSLEKLSNSSSAIALDKEVAVGKQSLVDAIEYKGGESSTDKSLQGIAEDIKEIPNFDKYFRLAGVLAGNSYNKDSLQGHNENVAAGNIEKLDDTIGVFTRLNDYAFQFWDLLTYVKLPSVQVCGKWSFGRMPNLKYLYLENYENLKQQFISGSDSIIEMQVGRITNTSGSYFYSDKPYLRNLIIGSDTDVDLEFNQWNATYVIAEGQSGIEELNDNLYNNLLTKLYDHSQDGQTRTLRLGWLAHVTQENIDYANSKGWTLTK